MIPGPGTYSSTAYWWTICIYPMAGPVAFGEDLPSGHAGYESTVTLRLELLERLMSEPGIIMRIQS